MASTSTNQGIEKFLETNLENVTDADPKTLTPYILALIHKVCLCRRLPSQSSHNIVVLLVHVLARLCFVVGFVAFF